MATEVETQDIAVNGESREVPIGYELTDLLRSLDIDPDFSTGIAVAVNAEVIPREEWGDVLLEEGDDVEVIQAQQGG